MIRKAPALGACRTQRASTIVRLAALEAETWNRLCLPRWHIRDVAAHLVAIDHAAVTGRLLPVLVRAPDRRAFERWNDRSIGRFAELTPGELLAALSIWGDRLQRLGRLVPAVLLQTRVRGPFGRVPLAYLLYRRALDEWVHGHDIASAAAAAGAPQVPAPAGPEVGDVLALAVLASLPHLALPAIDRRQGVLRIVVDSQAPEPGGGIGQAPLPAGGTRRTWGVDFARRQFGPRVTTQPQAVIRTRADVLTLLAEDRLRWPDVDPDALVVEGDAALAADFLDALPPASVDAR